MEKIGLILEGGGLRGVYTSGVLDFFMEKELYFPYIIGVSAGALNSLSYLSRQIGRSKEIAINLTKDKRLINIKNILNNKDVFGFDFYFNELSEELSPFDYETFNKSKEKLIVNCTDCKTGKPVYYDNESDKIFDAIKASSSLPIMNRIVNIDDKDLLDGGLIDPIPIKKAILDGYKKNVIILTNSKNFKQKPFKWKMLFKNRYSQYSKLIEIIETRHDYYNDTIKDIRQLEKNNEVFLIYPSKDIKLSRYKRNKKKLDELYSTGYMDAKNAYNNLINWINIQK